MGIRWLVLLNATISFEMFNLGIASQALGDASLQQFAIVLIWMSVFGLSFIPGVRAIPLRTGNLFWPALYLGYLVVSPLWASNPVAMAPKAVVYLITALTAWRLTSILSVHEILKITERSLLILCIASAIALIVMPGFAISDDWRPEMNAYERLWTGVFSQKQSLGMVGGYCIFIMLMRFLHHRRLIYFLGFVLGVVLTVGSGSRGAAAIAVITPAVIIAARIYPRIGTVVVNLILVCIGIALLFFTNLASSGDEHIHLVGNDIDLSDRTVIWQYAISHWMWHPILGLGLDGFWRDPNIVWGFLRVHHWVLDDFHSGYLVILTETGLIGFTLFSIITWQLCARLRILLRPGMSESIELVLGLILMTFVINLIETIFLRSTNYLQVLLNFLLIAVLSPVPKTANAARGKKRMVRTTDAQLYGSREKSVVSCASILG